MSSRGNPFEELERLFERMNRQFEEGLGQDPAELLGESSSIAVDLVDHGGAFVATVDLPGFERDDLDIRVTDRSLRIDANREETTEEEGADYLRQERHHESTQRSIRMPEPVDTEEVTAEMQNGVLTVTLPKRDHEGGRTIKIE